uniref:EGF-like domain-containing protein n=1 Tax=Oryzias melastigma TaxID=30732 RepID=A0A3B3B5A5_ORYME
MKMGESLFNLIVMFMAVRLIKCQTLCERQASLEWHPQKHTIQVNWTLIVNICRSASECWSSHGGDELSNQSSNFPQICPLQLQYGDKLLMSADETFKSYGIKLLNVSKDSFESCSTNGDLLFPHSLKESEQVEAKWITPGRHYFIAVHEGPNCSEIVGKTNCVRVCENGTCVQMSPTSFKCICGGGVSGPPCEKTKAPCDPNPCREGGACAESPKGFASECVCADGTVVPECRRQQDACTPSPCLNNGTCVSKGTDYVCRCLSGFSGRNCEEIIDYCRLLNIICLNEGLCLSVIGGHQCVCGSGWIGEFCQYVGDACAMQTNNCLNGATCITTSQPASPPQYTCKCLPGFKVSGVTVHYKNTSGLMQTAL